MTEQPRRITIEPPDGSTILAARHLDATEGPVQIGATVDTATRSAIDRVLAYIAKAHNSPTTPVEQPTTPTEEWCGQKAGRVPHPPHKYMRNRTVYQCPGARVVDDPAKQPTYPYDDGEVTVLGPKIFASNDGAVISWKGENYTRQIEAAQIDELYARITTLEHIAAGNKRHVQLIVPDLERAEAAIARVRAAVHIADTDDRTDWQRGYRACSVVALAALDGPRPEETDTTPTELTAEEARALVDELGTDLYRAQDALAFVAECCDIADREQRPITTGDVREWLKGARCGRQLAADAAGLREQPATVTDPEWLRQQYAAAMHMHYLCTDRNEADADGNLPCRCGDWREPGSMGTDEEDWDSHLADAVLRVRDRHLEQLRQRLQLADETRGDLAETTGRLSVARERLRLAGEALIRDGYFTRDEVGDDIAPRIVEWLSHHRGRVEDAERKFRESQWRAEDAERRVRVQRERAEHAEQRADRLAATLGEVIAKRCSGDLFGPSRETIDRWRAVLDQPKEPS